MSAIFEKNDVRVRVRVRGFKNFHVRVRVRVRGFKSFRVHVRVCVRSSKKISSPRPCPRIPVHVMSVSAIPKIPE